MITGRKIITCEGNIAIESEDRGKFPVDIRNPGDC